MKYSCHFCHLKFNVNKNLYWECEPCNTSYLFDYVLPVKKYSHSNKYVLYKYTISASYKEDRFIAIIHNEKDYAEIYKYPEYPNDTLILIKCLENSNIKTNITPKNFTDKLATILTFS